MIINHPFGGKDLPVLTTPAGAAQILSGYQAINANGEVVTGTIPSQGAQTIAPGTSSKTIASGRYLSGTQTIAGDSDLRASNIKSGVNIFGVMGSFSGSEPDNGSLNSGMVETNSSTVTITLPKNIDTLLGLYIQMQNGLAAYIIGMNYATFLTLDGATRNASVSVAGHEIFLVANSSTVSSFIRGYYCYIPA